MQTRYYVLAGTAVLVALGGLFFFALSSQPSGEEAARQVAERFGAQLQRVSLFAPDAAAQMEQAYGPYVAPALLKVWQEDVEHAPGKRTSSPYPAEIGVTEATPQGAGYTITGAIIMMAGGRQTGIVPVVMLVVPEDSKYKIVSYQELQLPPTLGE